MDERGLEQLEHRSVYRGHVLSLDVDRIREPGGKEVVREVVRHAGAAVILAVDDGERLILVRQYRYAVDDFLWEVPAGHLGPGESPEDAARRELVEETGYYPRRVEKLAAFYPSPGFSDELMHLFLAGDLEERIACPEDDEAIETRWFTLDEAAAMARKGEIRDGKTLLALMLLGNRVSSRV